MASNSVEYRRTRTEDTSRSRSDQIWASCPLAEIQANPSKGFYFRDDFTLTALLATPTITTEAYYSNGWKAFGSAGGTLLGGAIEGGQGLVATETDNDQGVNFTTLAVPFKIAPGKGAFWYESRIKINSIVTLEVGWLAGLMNAQTGSAILPITAAGALADVNFFGFRKPEASTTSFDTAYKADGVTAVTVKSGCVNSTDMPTTTAVAADTFFKIGMTFEPTGCLAGGYNQLSFFVNGFRLPDRYTVPTAAGTDFPNDVTMGLVFALLCGTNNDAILTVDWVEAAQLAA